MHCFRVTLLVTCWSWLSEAQQQYGGYFPPGTTASRWTHNMVLSYMDARSVGPSAQPDFVWTPDRFRPLVGFLGSDNKTVTDTMFDAFLMLGIEANDGKNFWPGVAKEPTNKTDWMDFANTIFDMGITSLDQASRTVSSELKPHQSLSPNVVIMIPYPDSRQESFGMVNGSNLNFSKPQDRIAAVNWYVDWVLARWDTGAPAATPLTLMGFYWFYEDLPAGDEPLLAALASHVHANSIRPSSSPGVPLALVWVPSHAGSVGVPAAKTAGVDLMTVQPNYAFQNSTKARFNETAAIMSRYELGVEMELPLAVRNPLVENWKQSFDDYCEAASMYGWLAGALKTYYYGNVFADMAHNSTLRPYYEKLFAVVKGSYPFIPPPAKID